MKDDVIERIQGILYDYQNHMITDNEALNLINELRMKMGLELMPDLPNSWLIGRYGDLRTAKRRRKGLMA